MKKKPLDVSGRAQRTPPSVAITSEAASPNRLRGPAPACAAYGAAGRKARRGRIERGVEWFDGNDHGD